MKRLSSFSAPAVARAFEAIVLATATASAVMVACGGNTLAAGADGTPRPDGGGADAAADGGLSYDGFTRIQTPAECGKPLSLLAGIHPAHESAAIQSRRVTVNDAFIANAADGGATTATGCREGVVSDALLDAYGDACAQASDKAACLQRVGCVTPPGAGWLAFECAGGPCRQTKEGTFYLEVTGDALTFPTDLLAMLGSIDTPAEAVLMANKLGYDTPSGCDAALPVAYREVGGAYELLVMSSQSCGSGLTQNRIRIHRNGTFEVLETKVITPPSATQCAAGRRPEGFVLDDAGGASRGLVAYLTELAALEAASIGEFATLRDELTAHGAPRALVAAAEAARRDEIVHARLTQRLARRAGGRPARVALEPRPPRSLEALAVHNAVEGCVRETFGALSATWQARHAADPELARAFARIAEDETRHAAFSWELGAWLDARLDATARARVAEARAREFEGLGSAQVAPHPEVATRAGVPSAAVARHLLGEMAELFALRDAA